MFTLFKKKNRSTLATIDIVKSQIEKAIFACITVFALNMCLARTEASVFITNLAYRTIFEATAC
jgi:hypothetical protein